MAVLPLAVPPLYHTVIGSTVNGVLSIAEAVALGLLAERPWTAYELASQIRRPNMAGIFWPVSERTWYRLPKRLVEAGLASAHESPDGGPTRYEITEAGRAALTIVHPDADDVSLSFRSNHFALLYATAGGPVEQSIDLLRQIQANLLGIARVGAATYRRRAADGPELPGRAHLAALLGRYITETAIHAYQWAEQAVAELQDLGEGDRAEYALRVWADQADQLEALLMAQGGDRATDT
jgi:DNA-binding PadR family transcriptional regulator